MCCTLGESEVALVGQRGVHQLGCVALVLVCVLKLCVHHPHVTHAARHQVVPVTQQTGEIVIIIIIH